MTEENGTGSIGNSPAEAPTGLSTDWVIVLIGARTLLGKLGFNGILEPAFELQMRPVPQQQIDPRTKQPVVNMIRSRFIMPVAEIDGFHSLPVPVGAVVKGVHELSPAFQNDMRQAVAAFEANAAAIERKKRIDAEVASAAKESFGGGARKD